MKATEPGKPLILFDGICNLCNRSVQYVIRHDPKAIFSFASLQGKTGQAVLRAYNLPANELNSFILVENGTAYTKSTAALKVAGKLQGPVKLLYGFMVVPVFIRNAVYGWIARNRYKWFGKQDTCMIPTPQLADRFLD